MAIFVVKQLMVSGIANSFLFSKTRFIIFLLRLEKIYFDTFKVKGWSIIFQNRFEKLSIDKDFNWIFAQLDKIIGIFWSVIPLSRIPNRLKNEDFNLNISKRSMILAYALHHIVTSHLLLTITMRYIICNCNRNGINWSENNRPRASWLACYHIIKAGAQKLKTLPWINWSAIGQIA